MGPFMKNEAFIRVFGPEKVQISNHVRGSNFCNLSLNVDERTGKLIVVSLIDNLVKGQAGQRSSKYEHHVRHGRDGRAYAPRHLSVIFETEHRE